MKKLYSSLACLSILCGLAGCKKDGAVLPDYFNESSIHSDDQARFAAEMDAIANDVNFALEQTPGFTGSPAEIIGSTCDATIVADTVSNPRIITINYNGTSCLLNRKRTGKIIISMDANSRWKNTGAVVRVNFVDFKITRFKDNKDMVINNEIEFTNVSGGLLGDLTNVSTITHTVFSDDLDILFDNGKAWSWKTARKRVYTIDNGMVITTTGTHSGDNVMGIGYWGNNRYGTPFLTPILIPLESREDCNYRIVSGKIEIILTDKLYATAKLGLDVSGNPISCPGTNSYFLELLWRDPHGERRVARFPY